MVEEFIIEKSGGCFNMSNHYEGLKLGFEKYMVEISCNRKLCPLDPT